MLLYVKLQNAIVFHYNAFTLPCKLSFNNRCTPHSIYGPTKMTYSPSCDFIARLVRMFPNIAELTGSKLLKFA